MPVKLCINCKYMGRITVEAGPGKVGRMDACMHPDFVSPVNGQPLPVHVAREHDRLCTFNGKGFVQREEEKVELAPPPQRSLILTND